MGDFFETQEHIASIKDALIEAAEVSRGEHRYSSFKSDFTLPIKFNERNIKLIFDFLKKIYANPNIGWEFWKEKQKSIYFGTDRKYGFVSCLVSGGYNILLKYDVKECRKGISLTQIEEVSNDGVYLKEIERTRFNENFNKIIDKIIEFFKEKYPSSIIKELYDEIDFKENNKSKEQKEDPLDILKVRYAKGEISKKEYDKIKRELTK